MTATLPYVRFGPSVPRHPVLISVPHAGRAYPDALAQLCRLSVTDLVPLEDRFADKLVDRVVADGFSAIIATTPRAWIDLNRAEREYDPTLVDGMRIGLPIASAKVRGGLGIIPRRIARGGDIWKRMISADAFTARLVDHHRPYHDALSGMIEAIVARFGVAIVLDLHSMPPLAPLANRTTPRVIIGDLFGRSAFSCFTDRVSQIVAAHKISQSTNVPYAGGYILERHGNPVRNVHALQIEIDRSLYLDGTLTQLGSGVAAMQHLVRDIVASLSDEAMRSSLMQAAE